MTSKTITRHLKKLLKDKIALKNNFKRCCSVWTEGGIVKSPFKNVHIPSITVPEYVWQNLERWSEKTATVCGITGRKYTYHQVYVYSHNFAVRLRKTFKVRDGDTVCVVLPNVPEFPIVTLGAQQAGGVVTTVNPIYTAHEISRQMELSDTKLLVCSIEIIPVIKEALNLAKIKAPIITIRTGAQNLPEGTISLQELFADNQDASILREVKRKAEDVCFLPYSSGTTGLPKGVELTNRNIVANLSQQDEEQIRHYNDTTSTHQDVTLAILPLFHIYGLSLIMLHKLSIGSKLVMIPKFHKDTFLNVLEEYKISLFYAAPPIVMFLGSHPDVGPKHFDRVNVFMCAAAPLPLADADKLLAKANRKLDFLQGYGLTETSPLATIMTRGSRDYGSVGYAIPNTELKIIDSQDSQLKTKQPNEIGELLIRGPQVMKGYRNNPKATEDTFADGWFRTGDIAKIDDKGAVTIQDRLKELIKVKGFQVAPAELEGVLKEHPSILDAAVIGVPDKKFGEVPKAFVVIKAGQKKNNDDIVEFVSKRVAEYKKIHKVTFLDELPKSNAGKILKRVLKEKYTE